MLTLNSDNASSNPAEVYCFYSVCSNWLKRTKKRLGSILRIDVVWFDSLAPPRFEKLTNRVFRISNKWQIIWRPGHRTLTIERGKYHCTTDLLFDWFGFNHTSKAYANSTLSKQLNPNKINRRSAVPTVILPQKLVLSDYASDCGLDKQLGIIRGATIAQCNRLRLPSCRPWFESQAHHRFHHL